MKIKRGDTTHHIEWKVLLPNLLMAAACICMAIWIGWFFVTQHPMGRDHTGRQSSQAGGAGGIGPQTQR